MSSPTQRSLALLKKEGWTAQVVEKWIPQAMKRIDLFGCIDILAIKDMTILGIQACAGSSVSVRIAKALAEPRLKIWLLTGAQFEVWGWRKVGPRNKRKLWQVRRVVLCTTESPSGGSAIIKVVEEPQCTA